MSRISRKKTKKSASFPTFTHAAIMFVVALLLSGAMVFYASEKAQSACNVPAPTTAAGYQQLIRGPVNGKIYRGDLGRSITLPNGKILWVFGDTLIGTAGASRLTSIVNNSALLTEKGCITALTGPLDKNGKETSWIKPTALTDTPGVNDYYWSSTPWMDGSTPRMFLSHMYNDASGFHTIGNDLVTFTMVNGVPKVASIVKTPGSANGETAPSWGSGVFRDKNYTYIFGNRNKNETWVFGHYYYLARVPNGQVIIPSAWRFWNGTTWVKNQAEVAAIIPGGVGVGSGITVYQKSANEYMMITKKYDLIGTDMIALKAPALTGPWTEVTPALLAPVPPLEPPMTDEDYTYLGLAHPQIVLPSGKLLVIWSLASWDISTFGDPRTGVYFSEVTKP
jgi:hypothetical protein